jgi:hypothetical protein
MFTQGPVEDWDSLIRSISKESSIELDLRWMGPNDRVVVKTQNSIYLLTWLQDGTVEICSNREKGPQGLVQIMGTTFGLSSSIRPDVISCGANLELNYNNGDKTWTTSTVTEIHHLRLDRS